MTALIARTEIRYPPPRLAGPRRRWPRALQGLALASLALALTASLAAATPPGAPILAASLAEGTALVPAPLGPAWALPQGHAVPSHPEACP